MKNKVATAGTAWQDTARPKYITRMLELARLGYTRKIGLRTCLELEIVSGSVGPQRRDLDIDSRSLLDGFGRHLEDRSMILKLRSGWKRCRIRQNSLALMARELLVVSKK